MISKIIDDELYQGYLAKVYQDTQGYQRYSLAEHALYKDAGICITYGELLYPSAKKIIHEMSKDQNEVFLDLGSGLGKCALQVFMQTELRRVLGIEASKELHTQALTAFNQVKSDFPFFWEEGRSLTLICDNFLHADWQDATIVYSCSTCFTQELLIAIGNKINQQPKVKQVFSFRPLPSLKLPLKKVFGVECSWDSALCFFYEKV